MFSISHNYRNLDEIKHGNMARQWKQLPEVDVPPAKWWESEYQTNLRRKLAHRLQIFNSRAVSRYLGLNPEMVSKHVRGQQLLSAKKQIELYELIGIDLPVYDTRGIYRKKRQQCLSKKWQKFNYT